MRNVLAIALSLSVLFLGACSDDPDENLAGNGDTAIAGDNGATHDFDTLDANGDSYLDTDEIAEWADDVGTFNEWDADADSELDSDEIIGNTFEVWDENGNGKIGKDEWENSAERWYPTDVDVIVYDDVDLDGDSEIDADEFAERFDLSALGETWTSDTFDQQTFETAYFELYDNDDDGKVTEAEWSSGSAAFGTPPDA